MKFIFQFLQALRYFLEALTGLCQGQTSEPWNQMAGECARLSSQPTEEAAPARRLRELAELCNKG